MQGRRSHNAFGGSQDGQGRQQAASPILGSSPVSGSYKGDKGAKKFYDRLRFDCTLAPSEYIVGFIESEQQPERKSGVEAWSMRVHDHLVELPFPEFTSRFAEDRVPFHRIAYYKYNGSRVWESEYHRRRLTGPDTSPSPSLPPTYYQGYPDNSPATGGLRVKSSSLTAGPHPGWQLTGGSSSSQVAGTSPPAPLPGRLPRGSREATSTSAGAPAGRSSTPGRPGPGNHSYTRGMSGTLLGGSDDEYERGVSDDDDELALLGQRLEEEDFDDDMDPDDYPDYPPEDREFQLPEECWLKVLHQLPVREVCMVARVNRWLRQLAGTPSVWQQCHLRLFGEAPPADWPTATTRRMCRRSELRAARWLEAEPVPRHLGNQDTRCLMMDDAKVVSGDGAALRVWSHTTGRRIATLQGHTGRVTCVTFDEEHVVSGCTQSTVRVWGMDDLKCNRTLRGHEGVITGVALLPGGIPVSSSEDGCILVWDTASSQPILRLAAGHPVKAITMQQPSGYLVSASGPCIQMWDLSSGQLLHTLSPPSIHPHQHTDELLAQLHAAGLPAGAAAGAHGAGMGGVDDDDDDDDDSDFTDEDELLFDDIGGVGQGLQGQHGIPPQHGLPFTSVSYSGNLLAASRADDVLLWDIRSQEHVGQLTRDAWKAVKPPVTAPRVLSGVLHGSIARAAHHLPNDSSFSGSCPADSFSIMFNGQISSGSPASLPNTFSLLGSSPPFPMSISRDAAGSSQPPPVEDVIEPSCFATAGVAAIAAGVAAPGDASRQPDWGCVGVQLDDWKLVVGLSDAAAARGAVAVHDIRAASCSKAQAAPGVVQRWQEPVVVLHAPARIHCFQFHSQLLLAGLENEACCLWSLEPPNTQSQQQPHVSYSPATLASGSGGGGARGGGSKQGGSAAGGRAGWEEGGEEGERGGRGGKKKPTKVPKRQGRYPKRNGK